MRNLVCLIFILGCQPTFAAVLADNAYVCKDKRVMLNIAGDPELAALDASQLSERIASAGEEASRQIATLDRGISKVQEKVEADRDALKAASALELQAGIRQNRRPTEQALRTDEFKLSALKSEQERLLGERQRWAEIATSCAPPVDGSAVVVINVLASSKVALVRVRSGASTMRVWVPTRFFVKSAHRKK
jgi:hypothetical protein